MLTYVSSTLALGVYNSDRKQIMVEKVTTKKKNTDEFKD